MLHELRSTSARLVLVLIAFVMLCAAPAMAIPVVYTDRTAFDAAAGSYTLLTLDAPSQTFVDLPSAIQTATYNDLITFIFDPFGGVGNLRGEVDMAVSGLLTLARVLPPVTAFGFDLRDNAPPLPTSHGIYKLNDDTYSLSSISGLNFLGFVSATPFTANIFAGGSSNHQSWSIDNIAIQAVPDPPTWLLGVLGGLALILARWRTSGLMG